MTREENSAERALRLAGEKEILQEENRRLREQLEIRAAALVESDRLVHQLSERVQELEALAREHEHHAMDRHD